MFKWSFSLEEIPSEMMCLYILGAVYLHTEAAVWIMMQDL